MNYAVGQMVGRLANDLQADHGTVYHAVIRKEVPFARVTRRRVAPEMEGKMVERNVSLCGKMPGPRSVGWDFENFSAHLGTKVTCPRCLKKIQKMEAA